MTAIDTGEVRYERKFVDTHVGLSAVEGIVKLHPAIFVRAFPNRSVNNVYLDTPGLDFFKDHANGSYQRYKLRVRWYGEFFGLVKNPVLETKAKRGLVGSKSRFPLRPFRFDDGFDFADLLDNLRSAGLPARIRIRIEQCSPSLVNRYARQYFVSADGKYRVTLDYRLRFAGIKNSGTAFLQSLAGSSTIIELKYAKEDENGADRIANFLPFRLTRNSKYLQGICMTRQVQQ